MLSPPVTPVQPPLSLGSCWNIRWELA
jgi:hypothetical protein